MNAKQEILDFVTLIYGSDGIYSDLKCAIVVRSYGGEEHASLLNVDHYVENVNEFLQYLDFEYDDGFGGQELEGVLWFSDDTWATRGEYDGSEWWEYHKLPEIPTELNNI